MSSLRLVKSNEYKTNELYIDSLEVAEMENELKSQTPQFKLPTTYKDALIELVAQIDAKEMGLNS
ncbi:hypothetical protein [Bacillus sp. UNC322MFChir4.1]|uniref:hypothetical protein n=1 Tax=Bacillus sp. UNC322MFChir4.1 TaxID=1449045 RepID=UPI000557978F|nr:hypothetical protein [Bacillus sp. UNC322MFChir4.1]